MADERNPDSIANALDDLGRRTKVIYSVNGKYKAQLIHSTQGGWMCNVWSLRETGRFHPLIRNLQPFETFEEALAMAQSCFTTYTGDDRYFAAEDIHNPGKPD